MISRPHHPKTFAEKKSDKSKSKLITRSDGYELVPVLYATNRKRTGDNTVSNFYGGYPAFQNEYGIVYVSIPQRHKKGHLETRNAIAKKIVDYSPQNYIELTRGRVLTADRFYASLQSMLNVVGNKEVLIFIHGFNNTFEQAAQRAAQLFYDLDYMGIPILYSWPSKGSPIAYSYDEEQAGNSIDDFKQFLSKIIGISGNGKTNVIAHSMGNRILTDALAALAEHQSGLKLGHVVMAAPDVYRDKFKAHGAKKIASLCTDVTVYVSSNDWALNLSRKWHSSIPRLGQADKNLFIMPPINTVDASRVNCSDIIGHSCFAGSNDVLKDIACILKGLQIDHPERSLLPVPLPHDHSSRYWTFPTFSK